MTDLESEEYQDYLEEQEEAEEYLDYLFDTLPVEEQEYWIKKLQNNLDNLMDRKKTC